MTRLILSAGLIATTATPMKLWTDMLMRYRWLMLLGMSLLTGCFASAPATRPDPATMLGTVGSFSLIERSGKTISDRDLEGKLWIASFVFTRCTESCPQVSGTVARLQKELAGIPDLRFVTFTVDPARDDPNELKKYADQYRADPERWLFLTGPEDEIKRVLKEQFHVDAIRNPQAESPGQEFDHSSKLILVDRRGNIRGYFDGMRRTKSPDPEKEFEGGLTKLKERIEILRKE